MEIRFTKRNETGLHCRFCGETKNGGNPLYETSPIKGIICECCKRHLENYTDHSKMRKIKLLKADLLCNECFLKCVRCNCLREEVEIINTRSRRKSTSIASGKTMPKRRGKKKKSRKKR